MTVASLARRWNEFFFKPQPPTPVALFRILYGAVNIANLALLRPDWLTFFGPHAIVSLDTVRKVTHTPRLEGLALLPQSDAAINAFFWVFLALALCLTVGFMTRFSSVALYLCLSSLHERNHYILSSADTVMRVTGFFLMFAPAGAALSVDRLIRIWRGTEGVAVPNHSPWAQRMIQIQISVVYLVACWWKTLGKTWMDGTAVYYVLRLTEFRRFPLPALENPFVIRFLTWSTVAIEFAAGVLVWFRDLRYLVLLAALGLHLGIEYSMNIPLFQWMMMITYVTFIYPEDLTRAWAWVRQRVGPWLGTPVNVVYDGAVPRAVRIVSVLQAMDVFGRLRVIDRHAPELSLAHPDLTASASGPEVRFVTPRGVYEGLSGLSAIAPLIPALWPLAPLALLDRHARDVFGAAATAR